MSQGQHQKLPCPGPAARGTQAWTRPQEGRGRGPTCPLAVSFGSFLTAHEHESPHGTRARLTVRHTTDSKTSKLQKSEGNGTRSCDIRQVLVRKSLGPEAPPSVPVTSLQLLPVVGQVAFALAPDADQPPSRPEAPAGGTRGAGQAAVPGGALATLLPAWPGRVVTHGVT